MSSIIEYAFDGLEKHKRFNYYFSWTDFSLGFSIFKPSFITGYKLSIGLDIGFLSCWMYLLEIKNPLP